MSSISINSNIASLNAQRRLGLSSGSLNDSFRRLSSGLRINKAGDDAAGLSIAESLNAEQRVFRQGVRNLNDGISLLHIADGAVTELSNISVRLVELAEQSANGTLSTVQRRALDKEAQALKDEFRRITQTTEFNGIKLFDGGSEGLRFQAGFGLDGGIAVSLGGAVGDGTFSSAISFEVGERPGALAAADLNNDGILDLIVGERSESAISILFGLGNGSYSAPSRIAVGDEVSSVITGDFNGDGILDLVTSDYGSDTISVLLGTGDGAFHPSVSTVVEDLPHQVVAADVNGDGKADLATVHVDGSIEIRLGKGDGSFEAGVSFAAGNNLHSLVAADFNNDGIIDIAVADQGDDSVSVLLGKGDGTFDSRVSYAVGSGPHHVALGDFNGDGVLDMVTADYSNNTVSVLIGNGDGSFRQAMEYAGGDDPLMVEVGDFNGDGIQDLITLDWDDASIFFGNGDGTFQARGSLAVGGVPVGMVLGDFSGDGVMDLFVSNGPNDTVSLMIGGAQSGIAPLLDFSLQTQAEAREALSAFRKKIDQLAVQRGTIGAMEVRLSTAVSTTQVAAENFSAARAQITDIDVAEESAGLIRNTILQQAGLAVLAQANQLPQLALTLLGGE